MKRLTKHLYFWVLVGITIGVLVGAIHPSLGAQLKPIADAFIGLIKMLITPIIFCTVVLGISNAGSMKKVGRVGAKALIYFEVISTLALIIGLVAVNVLKPGHGFHVDPQTLDGSAVSHYAQQARAQNFTGLMLNLIPHTFADAFTANGDILQVLLLALLFGYAMNHMGERGQPVHSFIESASHIFFKMMDTVMKLAPIGAGAAIAFTVGKYGVSALTPLLSLMGSVYLCCVIFIVGVLGLVSWSVGFSIFKFIRYLKEEILIVLGTSSSESALVPLMTKLEKLGCSKSVTGLVVPAGYSFNLDGTNIYLTMAAVFVAQALDIPLSLGQQLSLLGVAILTSKGASGVTGAGFITLAATLTVVPDVPVAGLSLILGIDRFMSEARSITNFIGNGVATVAISRWEGELDLNQLHRELSSSKK